MFRGLIEKFLCKHDWEVIHIVRYADACDRILLACKKCGKITKKKI